MRGTLLFLFVLTIVLAASALAQTAGPASLQPGSPVVIVGEISSHPRDFGLVVEKKLQLDVGPEKVDYTLHVGDAKMTDAATGKKIARSALRDKWWVRAEGTVLADARRIRVNRLDVIAKNEDAFRRSAYWASGRERGFIERVAGARQELP